MIFTRHFAELGESSPGATMSGKADFNSYNSGYDVISRKIRKAGMLTDFSTEYSVRSDDELLHLATQRHSLTTEAAAALDAELRRRNLTESDRVEHQKFENRQGRRESKGRRPQNIWEAPVFVA